MRSIRHLITVWVALALAVNAQIITSGMSPATQAAINAKQGNTEAYDDFGRFADGAISGSPQTGAAYRWNTATAVAPHVVDGLLVGNPTGELFYLGNITANPIKKFVGRVRIGAGAGASYSLHTMGFASSEMLSTDGTTLALPAGMLHIQFGTTGFLDVGFSEGGGANYEKLSANAIPYQQNGVYYYHGTTAVTELAPGDYTYTITFQGADMSINWLGRDWVFRNPFATNSLTYTGQPADGDTITIGSKVYRAKNTLAQANDFKIGVSSDLTYTALNNAVNLVSEVANTTYFSTTTVNADVAASQLASIDVLKFYARKGGAVGNSVVCTESLTNATLSAVGGFLTGGERTPIAAMGIPISWYYEAQNSPSTYRETVGLKSFSINDGLTPPTVSNEVAGLSTYGTFTLNPQKLTLPNNLEITGASGLTYLGAPFIFKGNDPSTGIVAAYQIHDSGNNFGYDFLTNGGSPTMTIRAAAGTKAFWNVVNATASRIGTETSHPFEVYTNSVLRMLFDTSGNVSIPSGRLILSTATPASAGATGTAGMVCWDASYFYICTATNTWKRVAIATW